MLSSKFPFFAGSLKGHINGLVDEGKSLWGKLAFRVELAENTKPAENLCALCAFCGYRSLNITPFFRPRLARYASRFTRYALCLCVFVAISVFSAFSAFSAVNKSTNNEQAIMNYAQIFPILRSLTKC